MFHARSSAIVDFQRIPLHFFIDALFLEICVVWRVEKTPVIVNDARCPPRPNRSLSMVSKKRKERDRTDKINTKRGQSLVGGDLEYVVVPDFGHLRLGDVAMALAHIENGACL